MCSQIKHDPYGVSRLVRVLVIGYRGHPIDPPLKASDIKAALPHLISFKNLQELTLGIVCMSLGILTPVLSSSPGTLKLHRWTCENIDIHELCKTSMLSSTFCQTLHMLAYWVIGAHTAGSTFNCRPMREARSLSGVSNSTDLRLSSASLSPYRFSRPAVLTFRSLISITLGCGA